MTESFLNFGVQPTQEAGSLNVMLGAVVFVIACPQASHLKVVG